MGRSSGDTLSLNNLAGARGITQGANVSLNAINSSAGTIVSLDNYGIDAVNSTLGGFTYAVEATNETYNMSFQEQVLSLHRYLLDIKTLLGQ